MLVPLLPLPQIAQSSVPKALRLTSADGGGVWVGVPRTTDPASDPVLGRLVQFENAEVFPEGSVAVAVTTRPLPADERLSSKLTVPPLSVVSGFEPM